MIASTKVFAYQQLIAGLQKHALNLVIVVAGQRYTTAQIVALLQSLIASANHVAVAKKAWRDGVVANKLLEQQNAQLLAALRQQVGFMYLNAAGILAEFGLTPKKPRVPLTLAKLAAAVAKGRATRLARWSARMDKTVAGAQTAPVTAGSSGAVSTATASTTVAPTGGSAPGGAAQS